jgi:hypothetical protein
MNREDLTSLIVEAVNARDPGLIEDLDVPRSELVTDRIEIIQERWTRLMMIRGDIEDRPVAVIWMPDSNEVYQPVAHVEVNLDGDDPYMTVIEGKDPDLVAEEPGKRTVAEWESVSELEGEGPDLI